MSSTPRQDREDPFLPAEPLPADALLRQATELFVSEPHHTPGEIRIFEELALQLLRTTPSIDKVVIARRLARHPEAPPAILKALLGSDVEAAAVVLATAPELSDVDLLGLVATGSTSHLNALAGRRKLPPLVAEALSRRLDPAGLEILADNDTVKLPPDAVRRLVAAARNLPALARRLASRIDIDDVDLIDLYLDLDAKGRRRVQRGLEMLALRDFASHRTLPRPPAIDRQVGRDVARAATARDDGRLAMLLGDMMGLDAGYVLDLIVDAGGEPLAVALKATGFDEAAATRIILFSGARHHRSYFDVRALVDLYGTISLRAASLLITRWRAAGHGTPSLSAGTHQPQTEAGTPVRSGEAHAASAISPAGGQRAADLRKRG